MSAGIPAFAVRDLSFSYGPDLPEVLHGVSLEIAKGTVTAILGPNGSGKTTLLNLLLGWITPTGGTIELEGKARDAYSRNEISRRVGIVPQDERPAFEISVLEYALLGRAPYLELLRMPGAEDRRLARAALETAGISALEQRSVVSLSGGERQLATVARALTQDPSILLLDEPMSHLDIANTRRVLRILESLKKEGRTVVLTAHDPNLAASAAETVILLKGGRLLAAGPAASVLNAVNLGATYGVPIRVVDLGGRPIAVTWALGED